MLRLLAKSRGKSTPRKQTTIEALETRQMLTGTLASTVAISDTSVYIQTGGSETFTATITPAITGSPTPTGTMEFYSYNGLYPTQTVPVQSDGTAQITLQGTVSGYMAFIASYSGDTHYAPSQSAGGTAVVNGQIIQPELSKNTLPASIVQGAVVNGSTTVLLTNPGNAKVTGLQTITVSALRYLGGSFATTVVGSVKRNINLAAGGSTSVVVPVKMKPADATAGDYSLVPTVTNKSGQTSWEISAASGVNSVVTVNPAFVDLSASLTFNLPPNAQALPGKPVSATLEIFNNGNVLANGNILTNFGASGHSDGSASLFVQSLKEHVHIAPGGHEFFRITRAVPIGSIPASYYLVATVDTTNTLNESDLTNNSAVSATKLTVLDPYPSLLGEYTGTYKILRGPDRGNSIIETGTFTDEDPTTGAWAGTAVLHLPTGDVSVSLHGTITTTGIFKTTPGIGTYNATGRLSKGVIHGQFTTTTKDFGIFTDTLLPG